MGEKPHLTVKAKRKFLIISIASVIVIGGCAFWIYQGFRDTYSIRTAVNARPEEVTFLRLPPAASHIGFWRDGLNYWAEFDIPERDFRGIFSKFQFLEISEPIEVRPKAFGDPSIFPPHAPATPVAVSNGLRYRERWSNGGGYDIIYDRARSRAYYDSSKR
ncbi:MAG: hypothetical protein WCK89_02345 [bacterium]